MLTWFGREKPKTAGGLPGPATVADVCAGADSARDGTRPCRRLWLPFIPPLTPECLGDFFFVQASKVAQFDNPGLAGRDLGKLVKRRVQSDDKILWLGRYKVNIFRVYPFRSSPSLLRSPGPRCSNQNASHHLRADCEELRAFLPGNIRQIQSRRQQPAVVSVLIKTSRL